MIGKWREHGANGTLSPFPIFIMGFAKDYSSTGLEKGRSVTQQRYTVKDDKGNFFHLRLDKHDQRVQVVLAAPDHETAFRLLANLSCIVAIMVTGIYFLLRNIMGCIMAFNAIRR